MLPYLSLGTPRRAHTSHRGRSAVHTPLHEPCASWGATLPRIVTIVSAPVANSPSRSAPGHRPVLLAEAVAALQPRPSGRYLDGTFGGGGHTRALLESSAPDGIVLALDADPTAVDRAFALRQDPAIAERLIPVRANFADLAVIARGRGVTP